jgi:hypothetical protein
MTLAESLAGSWGGTFFYPDGAAPVGFTITFNAPSSSGRFTGRLKEPNSFSMELVAMLRADVEGVVRDDAVEFTKLYTEGADHSVTYEGSLTSDGKTLIGSWYVGSLSGPFAIHLDRPAGELPLITRRPRRLLDGEWIGKALFTDTVVPLRVSLIHAGNQLRGRLTQGRQAGPMTGTEKEHAVRFKTAEGRGLTSYTGWLSPNGEMLAGGWTQGALSGHWLLLRS